MFADPISINLRFLISCGPNTFFLRKRVVSSCFFPSVAMAFQNPKASCFFAVHFSPRLEENVPRIQYFVLYSVLWLAPVNQSTRIFPFPKHYL